MSHYNYPPSPAMVAPEKLSPSAAFKKQVAKVITAIILFFHCVSYSYCSRCCTGYYLLLPSA
jgi:hypothetical protein